MMDKEKLPCKNGLGASLQPKRMHFSRAAGTATAQSDAALRTDPVRTQAPNTAANPAGRSAQKDFSLLELLGGTVVKGADEAVSRATSTAAWLERNTIGRLFPGAVSLRRAFITG